jgi:hypothetical protein
VGNLWADHLHALLAVICTSDDIQTMVLHALIRYRYREERK